MRIAGKAKQVDHRETDSKMLGIAALLLTLTNIGAQRDSSNRVIRLGGALAHH